MPRFYHSLRTIKGFKDSPEYHPTDIKRSDIKIAVLDNDGFATEDLAKTGFSNVTPIKTYDGIEPFSGFDVILCDMDGVGKSIDPKGQGATVAKTLKENYPNKLIFIYSGRQPEEFDRSYYKYCDGYLRKDQSMGELSSILAQECVKIKDPVAFWERYSKVLFETYKISPKAIAWLEDAYVRSLQEKKNKISSGLSRKLEISMAIINTITGVLSLFLSAL